MKIVVEFATASWNDVQQLLGQSGPEELTVETALTDNKGNIYLTQPVSVASCRYCFSQRFIAVAVVRMLCSLDKTQCCSVLPSAAQC